MGLKFGLFDIQLKMYILEAALSAVGETYSDEQGHVFASWSNKPFPSKERQHVKLVCELKDREPRRGHTQHAVCQERPGSRYSEWVRH